VRLARRLLVSSCLADLFRIYAPECPFEEDDQLREIFECFISQLPGLADPEASSYHRYTSMLERISAVRTFCLLPDLGCDDLVRQTFETLFNAARSAACRRLPPACRRAAAGRASPAASPPRGPPPSRR